MQQNESQISDAFRNYATPIKNFVFSKTGCLHTSEDLTQEVFIRLHRAKNRDEILDIRSYLYRVANNLVIDYYRSANAKSAPVEMRDLEDEHDLAAAEPTGEEIAQIREQIEAALRTVEELSGLCQKIFWLSRVEGFRNYEIAEMLGVCLSTVEKNISRATKNCLLKAHPCEFPEKRTRVYAS
tara:strand:- start:5739 stop:6287 length:549 start_codon:yes stop_codon:yes gene_type:complete